LLDENKVMVIFVDIGDLVFALDITKFLNVHGHGEFLGNT
jgi:hypothetical protein